LHAGLGKPVSGLGKHMAGIVKLYNKEFNCTNIYKFLFHIFMKARIGSILFVGIDPEPWSEILLPPPVSHYIDVKMLPPFSGKETEFHIEPELTLELMMAANYLHTWIITSLPFLWQVLLDIVSVLFHFLVKWICILIFFSSGKFVVT
jgi:hypothetical protein